MKKLLSLILALTMLLTLGAVSAAAKTTSHREKEPIPICGTPEPEVCPEDEIPQPAICPKAPDDYIPTVSPKIGVPVSTGNRDLSKNRKGQQTIIIAEGENAKASWHGVKLGDKKKDINKKLADEFPLMYELSAIGNMNLYSDNTVKDHYLTVYFDENDRVTMILWEVDQVITIDDPVSPVLLY